MSMISSFKVKKPFEEPKLQITAMMDMFTIIVFFLLFSYAEKPDDVELSGDIELPTSSAERDYENTIKVFLSATEVTVEGEVVATIANNQILGYRQSSPESHSLYQSLKAIRDKKQMDENTSTQEAKHEKSEDTKTSKAQVLFFCDKAVPFKVINTVMKTIGMVGYPNIQFAVTGNQ